MRYRLLSILLLLPTLPAAAYAVKSPSPAPDTEAADTVIVVDKVQVTAIKQGMVLRSQPVASSIVGSRAIGRDRVVALGDLSQNVPNLHIPDYGSRMTSSIYVRGLGARIDQPVVGLNIDNVPVMNKDNFDTELAEVERIEVLRGPQSTLYGRNTMGGVINIYTLSPLDWQGVRLTAEYGSGDSYRFRASLYEKLAPGLGTAVSGYYTRAGGFFENLATGRKCDWERFGGGRWRTQWRNGKGLRLDNSLSFSVLEQGGYPYAYAGEEIVRDGQTVIRPGEIRYNDPSGYRRTTLSDGLTLRYDAAAFSVSSITSYQYSDDAMTLDQDFLPLDYFTLTQRKREYGLTQDFVARGLKKTALTWLGGLFGFYKHNDMYAPVTFGDMGIRSLIEEHRNASNPDYPIAWDTRQFTLGSDFTIPTYGLAAYGQAEYRLGNFTLTGGLRLDYEHSTLRYPSRCATGYSILHDGQVYGHVPVDIDQQGRLTRHFLELLPKVAVSYRASEQVSLYASWTKGYKAGGFNTQMFSDVLQQRLMNIMGIGSAYDVDQIVGYKPEKSWNYEAGTHLDLLGHRLRLDASLFWIECRDQQLTMFPDGTTTGRIMTNAGRTRSVGGEFQADYRPTDRLLFRASYGYTRARFRHFNNGQADFAGKTIPYAPSNTLFLQAQHTFPLSREASLDIEAHTTGTGKIYWNEANTLRQPFYMQLGASATLGWRDFQAQLWGENLTGTRFDTFYFMSMRNEFLQRGRPWRIGITLRYNFTFL